MKQFGIDSGDVPKGSVYEKEMRLVDNKNRKGEAEVEHKHKM